MMPSPESAVGTERSALSGRRVGVVIPALDEQDSIGLVLGDLPWQLLQQVVVADNGSRDATVERARAAGAEVVHAARRGYGSACLAGLAALRDCDVVAFLDADYSDHPDELPSLLAPLFEGRAELVIGSRALGHSEPGALLPQQRFGNWLATRLMRALWKIDVSDLGPFRAISREALERLDMCDPDFGWTVEMQVKAAQHNLRVLEVPVSYRRRIGHSKIAGTLTGTLKAGHKILSTIAKLRLAQARKRR
ncbi:MAG: glycosyl hydrolase [Planctomycetota bacterium]|nr:MAG: glycosyl hydrolase [Planctomycetota bacterium]